MPLSYVSGVVSEGDAPSSGKLVVVFNREDRSSMGQAVTGEDGSYYIEFVIPAGKKVFVIAFRGELTITYDPDLGMDAYTLGDQTTESEIHDNITPKTVELPPI